ncbi:hypothetical protein [Nonomuraea sp. NEAU-A123]|uniref:hypothetical protein n=1 Tax=Nonomuraea sp. NEAU-A123 TaxID=2839649 RepID=UPI001BE4DE5D|nr:hypothetical protein [Nonomuraea sp. NEAU-A123]MBT2231777.1 hypothetical protein [Nonomuraea sp. NEAU-A123]
MIAVVLAIAGTVWVVPRLFASDVAGTAPEEVISVNPGMRATLLEVADRYLEKDSDRVGVVLASERPELNPKMFCHEELIEVRRRDHQLLLGLVAGCEELARSGNVLIEGGGAILPLLLTVQPADGRFSVVHVQESEDGALYSSSIRKMFSPDGAPRALELSGDGRETSEAVREEARWVFGLPLDAPVTIPTFS